MEITLRKGGLEARADPMGGELVSLRDGTYEYIWNGDPAYWSGRNPILFPIVGALRDGTVRIGQTAFHMARHGFAGGGHSPWPRREQILWSFVCGRIPTLWHSIHTRLCFPCAIL